MISIVNTECQDRATGGGAGFFSESLRSMSVDRRRAMVEPAHHRLSISAQCRLLRISRSSYYYAPVPETDETLALMTVIDDDLHGVPVVWQPPDGAASRRNGRDVGRRRVRRLMAKMGLTPIYQRPRTSDPHPQHRIYPYLLRKLTIERPNHVWCADVTYIPMRRGFLYLVAIMDWATRKVLAWRLSNTMDAGFCVAALEEALARFGKPEIFNTDQGSQFTSQAFTSMLRDAEVRISMDGRGRWMDNVFIERLWRSLKYECVYLHAFETGSELRAGLGRWITYYNTQRPHSGLAGRTPVEAYRRIGQSDHGGHAPHDLMIKQAA
jgi:putative transposase